jgi:hypothetical protein
MMAPWLAVAIAAAAAQSPSLDLRLQAVTEGTVASVREVGAVPKKAPPPAGAQSVGAPSDIEEPPPVGAVLYLPFGGSSGPKGDKKWRVGAAGTPEMQAELGKTTYEVTVVMDDGERRVFRLADGSRFKAGHRVTVRSGALEPLGS